MTRISICLFFGYVAFGPIGAGLAAAAFFLFDKIEEQPSKGVMVSAFTLSYITAALTIISFIVGESLHISQIVIDSASSRIPSLNWGRALAAPSTTKFSYSMGWIITSISAVICTMQSRAAARRIKENKTAEAMVFGGIAYFIASILVMYVGIFSPIGGGSAIGDALFQAVFFSGMVLSVAAMTAGALKMFKYVS